MLVLFEELGLGKLSTFALVLEGTGNSVRAEMVPWWAEGAEVSCSQTYHALFCFPGSSPDVQVSTGRAERGGVHL